MKNIQVIDGATNAAYSIYEISDKSFRLIFPGRGQDVEFIEDVVERLGEEKVAQLLPSLWSHRLEKRNAAGIHGTLFFDLSCKKQFYPNKQESDLDLAPQGKGPARNT